MKFYKKSQNIRVICYQVDTIHLHTECIFMKETHYRFAVSLPVFIIVNIY